MNLQNAINNNLIALFSKWCGEKVIEIIKLPQSGSYRQYYRLKSKTNNAIGVYNEDLKENNAYINFSQHFLQKNIKVPVFYNENLNENCYLIEDLGDLSLYSFLIQLKKENKWNEIEILYKNILDDLYKIQINGGKGLNYKLCYPRSSFDLQSMQWDLNYFKYHFLKIAKISFDEQKLENDFQILSKYLMQADNDFFLYRDFQSRNIMLNNNSELYYIDFQGGRRGAMQYDLASLLFESKVNLPFDLRVKLLNYYIELIKKGNLGLKTDFKEYYYPYVLMRLMQAMGAYGFRGLIEKKSLFIQSIPFVIQSIKWILENVSFKVKIPEILQILKQITESQYLKSISQKFEKLTISITSFSYTKGIPDDFSGNGGGYVFDCRHLDNPGKFDEYKSLTGKDEAVIKFLENNSETKNFIKNVIKITDQSVDKYLKRDFTHLAINFGCTGGQHRSVFSAEKIKTHLLERYNNKLSVIIQHREIG